MGRIRLGAMVTVGALALLGLAWPLYEPARRTTMTWQAGRPLDPDEASALERCEDPGWTALSRVIEQDLDVACPELWLAHTAADHVAARERRWVGVRLKDSLGPARRRFRYATALLLAGEPAEADWPFLVTDPSVGAGVRGEVVAATLAGTLPEDLLDPVLAEDLARARFLVGDLDGRDGVVRMLRRYAARPARASIVERDVWATAALEAAGFPGDRLQTMLERRRRGLSWQGPPEMLRILVNRGEACSDRASPGCLALAADLLVADRAAMSSGIDGGPGAEEGGVTLPSAPLRALVEVQGYDPEAVAAAGGAYDAVTRWIVDAPEDERAVRLLGAVAWPGGVAGDDATRAALVGDPVDVLVVRGGSPWAVALAASVLGESTAVTVSVHAAGNGVRIVAGDIGVFVGPCGGLVGIRAGLGAAWPVEAIVAQAALEAAGRELRAGNGPAAARLTVFAERVDPIGAMGTVEAVAVATGALSPDGELGRIAGARVASTPAVVPIGAEAERAARATAWSSVSAAWASGPVPGACPSVLGP